jgi:hypothetical protein
MRALTSSSLHLEEGMRWFGPEDPVPLAFIGLQDSHKSSGSVEYHNIRIHPITP